ncbi:hypothetical protein JW756_00620 [Candidatus Woesearchaeota archaeon]|nr:hypothetical protein [Candidatus Woesearchaeota archaeon]
MLLLNKKQEEKIDDHDQFGYTSKYVTDELELIQDQQENIIRVTQELEKAFAQSDKIKELMKIIKEIDKLVAEKEIGGRRKQESKMINLIEDVKGLINRQRYEDIDRLMLRVHQQSQIKVRLSQEELNNLRRMMDKLVELYQESAGLCRLYTLIYEQVKQMHDKCSQELGLETTEEVELSKAGAYKEQLQ